MSVYDEPIFKKCPALAALAKEQEPTSEHVRACLMELAAYAARLERQLQEAKAVRVEPDATVDR